MQDPKLVETHRNEVQTEIFAHEVHISPCLVPNSPFYPYKACLGNSVQFIMQLKNEKSKKIGDTKRLENIYCMFNNTIYFDCTILINIFEKYTVT